MICILCHFLLSPLECSVTYFFHLLWFVLCASSYHVKWSLSWPFFFVIVCQFLSSEVVCILTQSWSRGLYHLPVCIIWVVCMLCCFTEFHIMFPSHLCLKTVIYVLIVQWLLCRSKFSQHDSTYSSWVWISRPNIERDCDGCILVNSLLFVVGNVIVVTF